MNLKSEVYYKFIIKSLRNPQPKIWLQFFEDLQKASLIIYTNTSVCLEALMLGIPVIHLDLDRLINEDPLFEWNHLKWVVKEPEQLRKAIDIINNLNSQDFVDQQKKAREYLEEYFKRVNDENIKSFL